VSLEKATGTGIKSGLSFLNFLVRALVSRPSKDQNLELRTENLPRLPVKKAGSHIRD